MKLHGASSPGPAAAQALDCAGDDAPAGRAQQRERGALGSVRLGRWPIPQLGFCVFATLIYAGCHPATATVVIHWRPQPCPRPMPGRVPTNYIETSRSGVQERFYGDLLIPAFAAEAGAPGPQDGQSRPTIEGATLCHMICGCIFGLQIYRRNSLGGAGRDMATFHRADSRKRSSRHRIANHVGKKLNQDFLPFPPLFLML